MNHTPSKITHLLLLVGLIPPPPPPVDPSPPTGTFPPPRLAPAVPAPAPTPAGNPVLTADLRYVFDAPTDASVRTYPPGLMKFERKKGPRDVTARFYGGTGAEEDRSFAGPFVWVGRAVPGAVGEVTVVVTPYGLKSDDEIKTDTFRVDAGLGPQPPPKPKPVNPPKPDDPPAPKPGDPFLVILVYESGDTLTAPQRAVLFGKVVEDYLTLRCTGGKLGWTRRDKDAQPGDDTTALKAVWAAAKPKVTATPCIVIAVGSTVTLEPLPHTPAEAVALLKRYAGDK